MPRQEACAPSGRTSGRATARSPARSASLERAADLPSTILILGESGTGKDRLARAIHDVSVAGREPVRPHRRRQPLRRALRERALRPRAGRLHGRHRRQEGTARGRRGRHGLPRRGVVALAGGPGEVPPRAPGEELPAALAASTTHPFRARLIVSSRRDLAVLVEQGAFRDDFFYRIDVVSVRLPRLADRPRGHPAARARVRCSAPRAPTTRPARRFTPEAEQTLLRPPVARQRARAAARRREGGADAPRPPRSGRRIFRPAALGAPESLLAAAVESRWTLQELTDAYIDETLRRAGGNRSLAAKRLGVSRKFLWEREKK